MGDKAEFESTVEQIRRQKKPPKPPEGKEKPGAEQTTVTNFERDPKIVAWVLDEAAGVCECCKMAAPFERADGTPFLEVHHVWRLADGGPDTIQNAVAICPNCHRQLHYGADREQLAKELRKTVPRLTNSQN